MSRVKIQDHSIYKDKTNKQIVDRVIKIQRLLDKFGVKGYAFDPGVLCYYKVKGYIVMREVHMDFGYNEWEWLESLLRELLMYRRKYGVSKKKS
jgi:hypothetical protein